MDDEDERRDVRPEADGAAPDEEQSVASAEEDKPEDGDEGDGKKKKKKKQGSFWKELPILVVIAVALALVIKAFAVQAFYIPSGSMQNTLQIGDRVLVNKIVYHTRDVARGDIIVFSGEDSWDPGGEVDEASNPVAEFLDWVGAAFGFAPNGKDYIKRVIGIPGDHVACCDAQGRVTVNGVPLNESSYLYTDPITGEQYAPSNKPFDITVPPGHLWVMGDHRKLSYDSRAHQSDPGGGTIPIDHVVGRAFVIVWPLDRLNFLSIPDTFERSALKATAAVLPATPYALGAVGTLPIAYLLRRRRRT